MDLTLENKVVIVTGGASGIGKAIALRLAGEGAIPCIIDRDQIALQRSMSEITAIKADAFGGCAELTDPSSCKLAIDQVMTQYRRIDGLVNNAGINDGVGLENGSYDGFWRSIERNAGHYYSMAHFALPALKISKGNIVNICSKVAETGQGGTSGYAAANGLRFDLTSEWAAELHAAGIRVNAIVVSECFTPQYEWWISQQSDPQSKLQRINARIPLGKRMTLPNEIADTALFLLSSLSRPMSGEFFHVDGGYVHLDRQID